ncbi:MAG: hypothetical protein AAB483_03735 [Patescibacteria group bacterium]
MVKLNNKTLPQDLSPFADRVDLLRALIKQVKKTRTETSSEFRVEIKIFDNKEGEGTSEWDCVFGSGDDPNTY